MTTAVNPAVTPRANAMPSRLLALVHPPCFTPEPCVAKEHPAVQSVTEAMLRRGEIKVCSGLPDLPEDRRPIVQLLASLLGWYALDEDVGSQHWVHDHVLDLTDHLDTAQVLMMPDAEASIRIGGTDFRVVRAQSATLMWNGYQATLENGCVTWFSGYKTGGTLAFVGNANAAEAVDMMADFVDEYDEVLEDLRDEAISMMERLFDSLDGAAPSKSLTSCLSSTEYEGLPNTSDSLVLVYNCRTSGVVAFDAAVLGLAAELYAQGPDKAEEALKMLIPVLEDLAPTLHSGRA